MDSNSKSRHNSKAIDVEDRIHEILITQNDKDDILKMIQERINKQNCNESEDDEKMSLVVSKKYINKAG